MSGIRLNSIYMCSDEEKLEQYRNKLYMAIDNKSDYPIESDLPDIYIKGNEEIDLGGRFSKQPYYAEIDINLISSTNTSSSGKIYSNYDRVIESIPYIIENKCRPIAVQKDGDRYYIINGKHRFLAYTLLKEKFIPVSITERIMENEESLSSNSLIEYRRNIYNDGGYSISFPEQIMEFYKENEDLFKNICSVEMECLEKNKKYRLKLTKRNEDIIEIRNGISSGNEYRSSKVVKELLAHCGYDVDMEFIKTHSEFILKDKYDANNIVFNKKLLLEEREQEYIMSRITEIKPYSFSNISLEERKIKKLHTFLLKYEDFETLDGYITLYNCGIIHSKSDINVFYFVGSDSKDGKENYIYIFKDNDLTESNLKVRYLGRVGKGNILYDRVSDMKR